MYIRKYLLSEKPRIEMAVDVSDSAALPPVRPEDGMERYAADALARRVRALVQSVLKDNK